ncbi:MAG: rhodanese-like domain-containing protein [Luteimonas sp.]
MQATAKITRRSTMQEVLDAYPSAQRALFRRYHIGGCNSCGYEPGDILEKVAHSHNINDLDEVIAFIEQAEQTDRQLQISPVDVAAMVQGKTPPRLIDVRTEQEWALARIPGATLNTQDLAQEMMGWPKGTPIIFYCHFGQRSVDAASYFAGHGFSSVRSMTGGIDAWSLSVDASVPRYEVPASGGKAMLRSLRSVVSKAAGCQNQDAVQ